MNQLFAMSGVRPTGKARGVPIIGHLTTKIAGAARVQRCETNCMDSNKHNTIPCQPQGQLSKRITNHSLIAETHNMTFC